MRSKLFATNPYRLVILILTIEFAVMGWSGVWFSGLEGNAFISPGVDPVQWAFFIFHIPQYILSHAWMSSLLDGIMLAGLFWLLLRPNDRWVSFLLFFLFSCYYVTLTASLGHRNFQTGMYLIFIPLLFSSDQSKWFAWEALRYFILFFYVSAGCIKLMEAGLWNINHMRNILSGQLAPYFLENSSGWRRSINIFLVNRPALSQGLFILSVLIELLPFVGFFTKKWDRMLALFLILFHLVNWILMDIAPIGHLSLLSVLFIFSKLNIDNESVNRAVFKMH